MYNLLENVCAVITGAGQGIGEAIAYEFMKNGANTAILDIDAEKAEIVSKKAHSLGVRSIYKKCDVTDLSGITNTIESIEKELGKIDVWVNNAGLSQNISIEELEERDWDRIIEVNLKSLVFYSKAVFLKMKERRKGKIINIASLAGQRGGRFAGVNYSASKGGVIAATKSFALSGADYNITVNAIAPGLIKTRISEALGFSNSIEGIPLKRLGTPEDVGRVALFLASRLSDYITGQTISVNGGMYMV